MGMRSDETFERSDGSTQQAFHSPARGEIGAELEFQEESFINVVSMATKSRFSHNGARFDSPGRQPWGAIQKRAAALNGRDSASVKTFASIMRESRPVGA